MTTRPLSSYLTNYDSERARARGAYTTVVILTYLINTKKE
jgi:hypothetical protein